MRTFGFLLLLLCLLGLPEFAAAADPQSHSTQVSPTGVATIALTVTVDDPSGAPVGGARVEFQQRQGNLVAVQTTSAAGEAVFAALSAGIYTLRILAPGFAPKELSAALSAPAIATAAGTAKASNGEKIGVQLEVANPTEVVVVTSTLTPVPESQGGALISTLGHESLQLMQPVVAADALRFLPGALINTAGQRGGIASLFVRGGDSTYNKVILDGVPANDSGGYFNVGNLPLASVDRIELLRGADSALYGSDALTSVLQVWSTTGRTVAPEVTLSSSGGNFGTAEGDISVSQARGRFDYNLFGDEIHSNGQGVNNHYFSSTQGLNVGVELNSWISTRLRYRHANVRSGVPGEWNFNGQALLPPDVDARAWQNTDLASVDVLIHPASRWQHRISGFEYHDVRTNLDTVADRGCDIPNFIFTDCGYRAPVDFNRSGFQYQGEYSPRGWAHTVFGYEFEDENEFADSQYVAFGNSPTHGLRRNHALYGEELLSWKKFTLSAGGRYVHNESFGDRVVPRVAATYAMFGERGSWSGTRLRFSYATGIKAPSFEQSFGSGGGFPTQANPNLKPEEARAFEAGFEQGFWQNRVALLSTYFNNDFTNKVDFSFLSCNPYCGQYINVNKAFSQGVETELRARINARLSAVLSHTYTSTRIDKGADPNDPFADPTTVTGRPLLRRPHHLGTLTFTYAGKRWGGNAGGSFVGRRPDSDFLGLGVNHAAGYARVDLGAWYAIHPRVTAFANVDNATDRHYQEVVGYPALNTSVRAGLRFRIGGERGE